MFDPDVQAVIDEAELRVSESYSAPDDSDVIHLLAATVVRLRQQLGEAREERDAARKRPCTRCR